MSLRLFNTLTRTLEEFKPLNPPRVTMYVCGPTVYDVPHIGHARSAYIFDVLRRYLAFKSYQVKFVRNVTDVDDKIIEKARQEAATSDPSTPLRAGKRQATKDLKATCNDVAQRYLKSYHEALDRLGIARPDVEPKATEHVVPDMTDFISKLLMQGAAYEAGGDVYFAVRKFQGYGRLSNRSVDELQTGTRIEPGEHPGPPGASAGAGKQDPLDFALWKTAKPEEPSWSSPWGLGRPGWHIECSAMSTKELGDTFDIHGGGVDLVFPHHENEIAQSQAAGKPFARCWVHNGLLTVNGEKMSKSLGNFITVEQALEACHGDPRILKVLFLGTHYRSPLDYTQENLRAASGRWNRWYDFLFPAETQRSSAQPPKEIPAEIAEWKTAFEAAMDEDLNTPGALAAIDQLISLGYVWWKKLETGDATGESATLRGKIVAVVDAFRELGQVLGLEWGALPTLSQEEVRLLNEREAARKRKDFAAADKIRQELAKRGVVVEDTAHGPIAIPKR